MELLVDVANVLGSRADGWWRDRAGATTRLLARMAGIVGTTIEVPGAADGAARMVDVATVVLEGAAKRAEAPGGLGVIHAPGSGDDAIVDAAKARVDAHAEVLVVTADRGLRERLPETVHVVGPEWLNTLIGR